MAYSDFEDLAGRDTPVDAQIDAQLDMRMEWRHVDDLVGQLADETTEQGITSQERFTNAASSLFGWGLAGAQSVLGDTHAHILHSSLHRRIVDTLATSSLTTEQARRLSELQVIALAFAQIGARAREVAGFALEMGEAVSQQLQFAATPVAPLLNALLHQAFIGLRGVILISTSRNASLARRLLAEDGAFDQIYFEFQQALRQAIDYDPGGAFLFHQMLLVGVRVRAIGDEVRSICHAILHD